MLQRWFQCLWCVLWFLPTSTENAGSYVWRRVSDPALCLWEACLWSVIPETRKSGIHYMSLKFFSLHFLPSFFFFFFLSPSHHFYFPFQCLLPPHIHLFPPSFKCSSPILSPASFPPLPSPTLHAPSDGFLCPSNFSSNAARAAFHPPASGAASLCALLMRLQAGKPRKCQVWGRTQHGLCRAWEPLPCPIIWESHILVSDHLSLAGRFQPPKCVVIAL